MSFCAASARCFCRFVPTLSADDVFVGEEQDGCRGGYGPLGAFMQKTDPLEII